MFHRSISQASRMRFRSIIVVTLLLLGYPCRGIGQYMLIPYEVDLGEMELGTSKDTHFYAYHSEAGRVIPTHIEQPIWPLELLSEDSIDLHDIWEPSEVHIRLNAVDSLGLIRRDIVFRNSSGVAGEVHIICNFRSPDQSFISSKERKGLPRMFPLPASRELFIVSALPSEHFVAVDVLGRCYPLATYFSTELTRLDVSELPLGLYSLISPRHEATGKFTISR